MNGYPWLQGYWRTVPPGWSLAVMEPWHLVESVAVGVEIFAVGCVQSWLCTEGKRCGVCSSCTSVAQRRHPDLCVWSGAGEEQPSIDQMLSFMQTAPQQGRHRVVLIIVPPSDLAPASLHHWKRLAKAISPSTKLLFVWSHEASHHGWLTGNYRWILTAPQQRESIAWLGKQYPEVHQQQLARWLDWSDRSPLRVQERLQRQELWTIEEDLLEWMWASVAERQVARLGDGLCIETLYRSTGIDRYGQQAWNQTAHRWFDYWKRRGAAASMGSWLQAVDLFLRSRTISRLHHPLRIREFCNYL